MSWPTPAACQGGRLQFLRLSDGHPQRLSGFPLFRLYAGVHLLLQCAVRLRYRHVGAVRQHCSKGMLRDLGQRNAYWKQFEGKTQEISSSINNSFLTSQGEEEGVFAMTGWCS